MADGFVYDDGGRVAAGFKGSAGDCVARAVAIASGRPYAEVYARLAEGNKSQRVTSKTKKGTARKATASDGIYVRRQWFRNYMAELGATWTPTMQIGKGCTVHLDASELPAGRLVVSVSKHYTAMIDGVVRDTHDPRRGGEHGGATVYSAAWPADKLPKGAEPMPGGGWKYDPRRCVYGYWTFPG